MNCVTLMGRLTRDPELRQTQNGIPVATFTLAVERRFKNQQGETLTDFIPVVAWRQQAEFAGRWFQQGMRVAVIGSMQVRTWDDRDGNQCYVTEVITNQLHFADGKREDDGGGYQQPQNSGYQQGGGYGQQNYRQQAQQQQQQQQQPAYQEQTLPGVQQQQTQQPQGFRQYEGNAGRGDANPDYYQLPDDDTALPFDI